MSILFAAWLTNAAYEDLFFNYGHGPVSHRLKIFDHIYLNVEYLLF